MGVAAVRKLFDSWKAPVPPRHLVGNIYYVGAIGVSSYLITTPEGHILLDTGFEDTVPIILRGVEQLEFDPATSKSSSAVMPTSITSAVTRRCSGRQGLACWRARRTPVCSNRAGADDFIPFPRETILFTPVKVDRIVADGEQVSLGGVVLTAHLTPGHTRGATMDEARGKRRCSALGRGLL